VDLNFVKKIRELEINMVLERLRKLKPEGCRILEIGAGGGWQAKRLSLGGYQVDAIDIMTSRYRNDRNFDVVEFNGVDIPFPDKTFDIIFSSNVLEHVGDPEKISSEISRCLKENGIQLHLVPSGSWRVLTTLTYYPFVLKYIFEKLFLKPNQRPSDSIQIEKKWKWYNKLLPTRHGEKGNVLSEIWWFSRWGWKMNFKQWGLDLTRVGSNNILYSGSNLCGGLLNLKVRRVLASLLGSSCHIYEGKKADPR
jgi:2-polyprenyl-3-methyl-5-hydroxy-6-metoxy-1,4-benzoquinol methylase